jgi:hypothetical protein
MRLTSGALVAARAALWLTPFLIACPSDDAGGSGGTDAGSAIPDVIECERDGDCRDDGRFCNGGRACVRQTVTTPSGPWHLQTCQATPPPCAAELCDEAHDHCNCADPDMDGDGSRAIACGGTDCDDTDPLRFPGKTEVCDSDNRDEDCDPSTYGTRDADGDGVTDQACCNGDLCGFDCDDRQQTINPTAPEVCDGRDNDCDGAIDEGVIVPAYTDADGDGWGAGDESQICAGLPGYASIGGDCDDTLANIHPGAFQCVSGSDIELCTEDGTWSADSCPGLGLCVPQPDGTGVCLPGDESELPQCSDGADNDDDGKVDFGDPQCTGPLDNTEAERACQDGLDNDGDGRVDYPDDPGCSDGEDNTEVDPATLPACSNGLDDDNDGIVDYGRDDGDPGCVSASDDNEREATGPSCDNGVDDDMDGPSDYPADKSCAGPDANTELEPACSNGLDDDLDGKIDFPDDPGCNSAADDTEREQNGNYICDNGLDDDKDGAFDYPADPGCTGPDDSTE